MIYCHDHLYKFVKSTNHIPWPLWASGTFNPNPRTSPPPAHGVPDYSLQKPVSVCHNIAFRAFISFCTLQPHQRLLGSQLEECSLLRKRSAMLSPSTLWFVLIDLMAAW